MRSDPDVVVLVRDLLYTFVVAATGEDIPRIAEVNPPMIITNGMALLFADGVTDADGIAEVWVELSTPTNYLGNVTTRIDLAPAGGNRWEALYTDFANFGAYTLTVFARDTLGNRSPGVQTTVLVASPAQLPPGIQAGQDLYEPDNVETNATYGDLPILQYHTLDTTNDCDWVFFYAASSQVVDVETIHLTTNIDTRIELYHSASGGVFHLIDSIDEFGNDLGELAGLTFPTSGYYYVKVCQAEDGSHKPGAYLLSVYLPVGVAALLVTAVDVLTGGPLAGAHISIPGLGSGTTDRSGSIQFGLSRSGTYTVTATPPGQGYKALFGENGPHEFPNQMNSDYGNPRQISDPDFGTTQSGLQFAGLAFGFIPTAKVKARLVDPLIGKPVEGIRFSLVVPGSDPEIVYDQYPWLYGIPWASDNSGDSPGSLDVFPNQNYDLYFISTDGRYMNAHLPIRTGGRGQVLDLGDLSLPAALAASGLPLPWLSYYGLPTNILPGDDPDLDGQSVGAELITGTDPNDINSSFFVQGMLQDENGMSLHWVGQAYRTYQVTMNSQLDGAAWSPVSPTFLNTVDGAAMQFTLPDDLPGSPVFRVEVALPANE